MAGHSSLRDLKKRQRSIDTAFQLSGAMKTVSAAKFSRCSIKRNAFGAYSSACGELIRRFGSEISNFLPCKNPDAPACFVIFSSNRGLCGSFNNDLFTFSDQILSENPDALVISCQKMASFHLKELHRDIFRETLLPDVPDASGDAFAELCSVLRDGYLNGDFSSVTLIYQKYVNMLTQTPVSESLLPLPAPVEETTSEKEGSVCDSQTSDFRDNELPPVCFPDKDSVLSSAADLCFRSALFTVVLSAATGAQAATLMAMRAAYDNAEKTGREISIEISRMRQSAITSGVIETSSDMHSDQ